MPSPAKQFFMGGPCEDLGYLNTRDHPRGAEHKVFVEELWRRFRPYADSHFREKARHEFHQRFWEMYLGVSLLEHGFVLQPHRDEGPDLCTCTAEGTRVWFEAVAPGPGSGHDQVPPVPRSDLGEDVAEVPTEKILLRFTNALSKKQEKYGAALAKGIIRPDDGYVLAINSRGIRLVPFDGPMPLFVRAFLPYGPLQVAFDSKTRQIVDRFYQYRPAISKLSGRSVSTRTFLDHEASFCSAVLHSSVDCANHPPEMGGDFGVLHNPRARHHLDPAVFDWCTQFIVEGDRIARTEPNPVVNPDAPPEGGSRVTL